jgi:MFS family permease
VLIFSSGVIELMSWGALYYAVPVLYGPIGRDTGWSQVVLTLMYSCALIVAALLGPLVGAIIDSHGPRKLVIGGALIGAFGLVLMGLAPSPAVFAVGILTIGVAQSATLYPPVFAALTIWFGPRRNTALTIVSLFGGASSAVFAPVFATLSDEVGWRLTLMIVATVFAAVTSATAWFGLRARWPSVQRAHPVDGAAPLKDITGSARFRRLQLSMLLTGLGLYAVTLNLVALVQEQGHPYAFAALVFGLVGAGQVAGRLLYLPLARWGSPRGQTVFQVASAAAAIALLGFADTTTAIVVAAVVAGMVRGAHTLVTTTGVADRWGAAQFGALSGRFNRPVALGIAVAPFAGAGAAHLSGGYATATLAMACVTALALVPAIRT